MVKKLKLLFVIDSLCLGGAQRQLIELALSFRDRGDELEFLTYHEDSFFAEILSERGIRETCIPGSNYLDRLIRMRRYIRQGHFDVVISFLEASSFICEVAGWPSRSWTLIVGERSANPRILSNPKLRIYRWFHVFADFVVSNSSANLALVRRANPLLGRRKLKRIFNVVDFSNWYPGDGSDREEGQVKLVTAARFHGPKNLDGLAAALQILDPDERAKLKICWYGIKEGDPVAESQAWLRETGLDGNILLLPATMELAAELRNADAVVLVSLIEGLPNVVCEGMACALPVLCSSISDIPEILKHQQSLLFDPADPRSIAASFRVFLGMNALERAELGRENLEVARREFDRNRIRDAYLELIK